VWLRTRFISSFVYFFVFRSPIQEEPRSRFFIQDDAGLLHVGDAHQFPLEVHPDILCLPWRASQLGAEKYKSVVIEMARKIAAPYILPIHYDLHGTEANPKELVPRLDAVIMNGEDWHTFENHLLLEN